MLAMRAAHTIHVRCRLPALLFSSPMRPCGSDPEGLMAQHCAFHWLSSVPGWNVQPPDTAFDLVEVPSGLLLAHDARRWAHPCLWRISGTIPARHTDVNKYNSDGRVVQVEYAMKAMNLGTTTIGVTLRDCAILISEKKLGSTLQLPHTVRKHFKIYDTVLCGISGISSDAPAIIRKCREFCLQHDKTFNEQMGIERLMEKICALALNFGEDDPAKMIFSRPFGVSLLVAAYENGPRLYNIDPSGSYLEYRAHSIGSAQEVVEGVLESEYDPNEDAESCIRKMLGILKNIMKEKMTQFNVEVSTVGKDGVSILTPSQIAGYL